MLSNIILVAGNVFTLLLMMLVGYILVRIGWLTANTQSEITKLLLYIVTPCIIITGMPDECNTQILHTFGIVGIIFLSIYIVSAVIAWVLFRGQPQDTRASLINAAVYGNALFMGLPLLQSVLGDEAIVYGVIGSVVINIFTWTHGAAVMGGRERISAQKAIINPGVIGFSIGFLLFVMNLKLPAPVDRAMVFMSNLNTPLAMIIIGTQIASADIMTTFKDKRLYLVTLFRLIIFPVMVMLVLLPFHPDTTMYLSVVILTGCPSAAAVGMFAQQFNRDRQAASQAIAQTTLLSIIAMPLLAAIGRTLIGL